MLCFICMQITMTNIAYKKNTVLENKNIFYTTQYQSLHKSFTDIQMHNAQL